MFRVSLSETTGGIVPQTGDKTLSRLQPANPRTLKEFSSELIKGETRLLQAGRRLQPSPWSVKTPVGLGVFLGDEILYYPVIIWEYIQPV